eukprot:m.16692 g.16692  ORF g.16692 m.16692 type:complete len:123 (-) comp7178_c0_seq1:321-689(-)
MASTNAFGRYVCQLRKLRITYCRGNPSSQGTREFIDKALGEFVKANPQVVVEVAPVPSRQPKLTGFFLNGRSKVVPIENRNASEVESFVTRLRNESGGKVKKIGNWTRSNTPSIQGDWQGFL